MGSRQVQEGRGKDCGDGYVWVGCMSVGEVLGARSVFEMC